VDLNYLVSRRQQRPWGLLVLGHGLSGATAAAAGMGEPSLWASGFMGPACWVQAPGGQCSNAASTGDPSLGSRSLGACLPGAGFQEPQELLQSWENKAVGSGSSGTCLLSWGSGSTVQWYCRLGHCKPVSLHLLLPVEQWEPCVLLMQVCPFPWHFTGQ
jgi:hypothetical protein